MKVMARIRSSLIRVDLSPYTKNKVEEALNSIDSAILSQAPEIVIISDDVYNVLVNMDIGFEFIFKKVVEIT